MADFILLDEDFSDFPIGEFPYDKNHSAMGEYHFIHYPGYYGKRPSRVLLSIMPSFNSRYWEIPFCSMVAQRGE